MCRRATMPCPPPAVLQRPRNRPKPTVSVCNGRDASAVPVAQPIRVIQQAVTAPVSHVVGSHHLNMRGRNAGQRAKRVVRHTYARRARFAVAKREIIR